MACIRCRVLVFVLSSMYVVPHGAASSSEDFLLVGALRKEAEYHIGELSRIIDRLESAHHSLSLSPDVCQSLRNYRWQLLAACFGDATEGSAGPEDLNPEDAENAQFNGKDHPSTWKLPDLYLTSAEAQRRPRAGAGNVTETFLSVSVRHTSQAFVMRMYSFDSMRTVIGASGQYGGTHVTSTVELSIDSSNCRLDEIPLQEEGKAKLLFGLIGDTSTTVSVSVDVCRFDQRLVQVDPSHGAVVWISTGQDKVSQTILPATFRLLGIPPSNSNDADNIKEILVTPRGKVEFVMDILFQDYTTAFKIVPRLWSWDDEKLINGGGDSGIYVDPRQPENKTVSSPLVTYTVLTKTVLNGTNPSQDNNLNIAVRVRVCIDPKISGTMSGKLKMLFAWVDSNLDAARVVRETWTESYLSLRLLYKLSAFPEGSIFSVTLNLNTMGEKRCGRDGDDSGLSTPRCIVECHAEGSDLKGVFVIKTRPYKAPVKSVSYVVNGMNAYSRLYMGLSPADSHGDYRCVVVTKNGNVKTKVETLHSLGFTRVRSVTIEEGELGVSSLTCEAEGTHPINMTLSLLKESGSDYPLYPKNSSSKSDIVMKETDNSTTYTIEIKTKKLLFPTTRFVCQAQGKRGRDTKSVAVSRYIKTYNRTAPVVIHDQFRMELYPDGTSRIICSATGGKSVEIRIEAYGLHIRRRLDNKQDIVRKERTVWDKKTVVLDVPAKTPPYFDSRPKIYCLASNAQGRTSKRLRFDNVVRLEKPAGVV